MTLDIRPKTEILELAKKSKVPILKEIIDEGGASKSLTGRLKVIDRKIGSEGNLKVTLQAMTKTTFALEAATFSKGRNICILNSG